MVVVAVAVADGVFGVVVAGIMVILLLLMLVTCGASRRTAFTTQTRICAKYIFYYISAYISNTFLIPATYCVNTRQIHVGCAGAYLNICQTQMRH